MQLPVVLSTVAQNGTAGSVAFQDCIGQLFGGHGMAKRLVEGQHGFPPSHGRQSHLCTTLYFYLGIIYINIQGRVQMTLPTAIPAPRISDAGDELGDATREVLAGAAEADAHAVAGLAVRHRTRVAVGVLCGLLVGVALGTGCCRHPDAISEVGPATNGRLLAQWKRQRNHKESQWKLIPWTVIAPIELNLERRLWPKGHCQHRQFQIVCAASGRHHLVINPIVRPAEAGIGRLDHHHRIVAEQRRIKVQVDLIALDPTAPQHRSSPGH